VPDGLLEFVGVSDVVTSAVGALISNDEFTRSFARHLGKAFRNRPAGILPLSVASSEGGISPLASDWHDSISSFCSILIKLAKPQALKALVTPHYPRDGRDVELTTALVSFHRSRSGRMSLDGESEKGGGPTSEGSSHPFRPY
jgi:hypothetical protein